MTETERNLHHLFSHRHPESPLRFLGLKIGAHWVPGTALQSLAGSFSAVHPNDTVTHPHGTSSEGMESRGARLSSWPPMLALG